MFILLILLWCIVLSNNGLEVSAGKRAGQDLSNAVKVVRNNYYGEPSLEGMAGDVNKIILTYVMAGNSMDADARVHHAIKVNHSCFRINKKLNQLSWQVSVGLLDELCSKYPEKVGEVINKASYSSKNLSFLRRFINCEKTKQIIFDLTPRITPLMIAVGFDNKLGVDLLLDEARRLKIYGYVNVQCGQEYNTDKGHAMALDPVEYGPPQSPDEKFYFTCNRQWSALHVASDFTNGVSNLILLKLLELGANPNARDACRNTPLYWAISGDETINIERVCILCHFGADPDINNGEECPDNQLKLKPESPATLVDDWLGNEDFIQWRATHLQIKHIFNVQRKRLSSIIAQLNGHKQS